MLRKTLTAIVVAAFAGSTGLEFAAAMPMGSAPAAIKSYSNIETVATWVYVGKRHGPRYRAKRKGYGYYYGGYWYARPWWTYGARPGRAWVYGPKYGPRYRAKRKGYGYYYNGWWYARPYWRPGINICIGC